MPGCFTIYCHTNKVNGKRYVGQTVSSMEFRWKDHLRSANRNEGVRLFGRALRKYGADAFEHEVLETVETQVEADVAEAKWIAQLQSRAPKGYNLAGGGGGPGYHHDDSKRLIGEAASKQWLVMTPEQQAKKVKNLQTPNRLARSREANSTKEFGEKVRAGQKAFWAGLSPEEKTRRVKHQMTGVSAERKSDRVRKVWAKMTPEAREARVRKMVTASAVSKATPAHSKMMSEFQTAQAKLRTPEQRRAMVLKSWETRRAKHGQHGVKRVKTSEEYAESTKRGWAAMSPEAHAERVRKTVEGRRVAREGRRLAREAKAPRLVLINLLRAP
jgi:group I intron endonuclease